MIGLVSEEMSEEGKGSRESFTDPVEYRKVQQTRVSERGNQGDIDGAVVGGVLRIDDSEVPGEFCVPFLWGEDRDLDGDWCSWEQACSILRGNSPLSPGWRLADFPGKR